MSVGFQAGYQDYSQLIVFENHTAMDKFKRNEIDFGANASAVVADKGRPWAPSGRCGGFRQARPGCDG